MTLLIGFRKFTITVMSHVMRVIKTITHSYNPRNEGQKHALNCWKQRNSTIWNSTSITSLPFNNLHTLVIIFWTNFAPVPKPVKRRSTSGMCGYTSVTVETQWRPGRYWNKIGVYDVQRKLTWM